MFRAPISKLNLSPHDSDQTQAGGQEVQDPLTISIYSFGYHKSGIPEDASGNGGGFVFDCRGLPNPGRLEYFENLTGQDREVVEYMEKYSEVRKFLQNVYKIVEATAKNYRDRLFTHLMVAFGCTGGQHRSVYCAEKLAAKLKSAGFHVQVRHVDKPDLYA